jgi:hypothetical protein
LRGDDTLAGPDVGVRFPAAGIMAMITGSGILGVPARAMPNDQGQRR